MPFRPTFTYIWTTSLFTDCFKIIVFYKILGLFIALASRDLGAEPVGLAFDRQLVGLGGPVVEDQFREADERAQIPRGIPPERARPSTKWTGRA